MLLKGEDGIGRIYSEIDNNIYVSIERQSHEHDKEFGIQNVCKYLCNRIQIVHQPIYSKIQIIGLRNRYINTPTHSFIFCNCYFVHSIYFTFESSYSTILDIPFLIYIESNLYPLLILQSIPCF